MSPGTKQRYDTLATCKRIIQACVLLVRVLLRWSTCCSRDEGLGIQAEPRSGRNSLLLEFSFAKSGRRRTKGRVLFLVAAANHFCLKPSGDKTGGQPSNSHV